jgi:FMN-dependent oxidoreductase (nitrilotriacetate monooxygenase family)
MSVTPFHLGWFVDGFRTPSWNKVWSGSAEYDWVKPDFYVDMARSLERAKFDMVLFADSSYVGNSYGGTSEIYLKLALNAPMHDPSALAAILAQETSRIGIVPTLSTTEWRPFQVARYMSTLDHFSDGRIGWNIVTGGSELAAQNYGVEDLPSHDERYDMADEFVDITSQLWGSWEPDAVVRDHETGVYADHTKVHAIDYEGRYFKCRGPLTTVPSPQGRPVLMQAGSSGRGREFAAKHADLIVGTASSVETMKAYRDDIHARLAKYGRKPADCKVLFLATPIVADTDAEALERSRLQGAQSTADFEARISGMSKAFEIDLSKFDLDKPLPADLKTEGHQGMLATMVASGRTLREIMGGEGVADAKSRDAFGPGSLIGSPATVAARMGEMMEEVGGDGFLIVNLSLDRRYISEITDGLVPALQRRGLTRSSYEYEQFRDNLLAF